MKSKKDEVSIYIATHKEFKVPNLSGYKPIRVGAKLNNEDYGYLRDDTGNNISDKNKNYCELTALYWIWKNDKSDIVGLTHYRRYFYNDCCSYSVNNIVSNTKIEKILKKYDIILPMPLTMVHNTVESHYERAHKIKDLHICGEIIKRDYPDYYKSYEHVLKRHYFYACNMLICKKKIFNDYMEWLFDILFKAEKKIDMAEYTDYDKRVFGFLSERLFNVWLYKNKRLKKKELPIYNTEQKFYKQFFYYIKDNIKEMFMKLFEGL